MPLRERNMLLLAAGYAPRYAETSLDAAAMAPGARRARNACSTPTTRIPGVVIDRLWNVVLANRAAGMLTTVSRPSCSGRRMNVFRVCLHPDGLAGADTQLPRVVRVPARPAPPPRPSSAATARSLRSPTRSAHYPNLAGPAGMAACGSRRTRAADPRARRRGWRRALDVHDAHDLRHPPATSPSPSSPWSCSTPPTRRATRCSTSLRARASRTRYPTGNRRAQRRSFSVGDGTPRT